MTHGLQKLYYGPTYSEEILWLFSNLLIIISLEWKYYFCTEKCFELHGVTCSFQARSETTIASWLFNVQIAREESELITNTHSDSSHLILW